MPITDLYVSFAVNKASGVTNIITREGKLRQTRHLPELTWSSQTVRITARKIDPGNNRLPRDRY
jgi:hypothetical protein